LRVSARPQDKKKTHEDYNALVDAIIQISPPYNNEKSDNNNMNANNNNHNNMNNNNINNINNLNNNAYGNNNFSSIVVKKEL
jgi:hypothetical protein